MGTVVVTLGEAVVVVDITGAVVVVVWTMRGVGAVMFPFWHLIAVMMMISMITIMTAAPLDPMIGTLWLSRDSKKEKVESLVELSNSTLLRTNTVSLKFSFSSFQCCSIILIRWLEK